MLSQKEHRLIAQMIVSPDSSMIDWARAMGEPPSNVQYWKKKLLAKDQIRFHVTANAFKIDWVDVQAINREVIRLREDNKTEEQK